MTNPWDPPVQVRAAGWEATVAYRARVRGCLLGGAIGDALGYAVEFTSLDGIRAAHGPGGVRGPLPDAAAGVCLISDDTQMTLFTAEALRTAHARERRKGIGGAAPELVRQAYMRWLDTQMKPGPEPRTHRAGPESRTHRAGPEPRTHQAGPEPQAHEPGPAEPADLSSQAWLYAQRAPGNACLSGLQHGYAPDPAAELGPHGPVNPESKGCGTVMRSAPFGLTRAPAGRAFELAARCAQITHGHPTGYYAAGALAAIVAHLVEGDSLEGAVLRTLRLLARYAGHEETSAALTAAVDLAAAGGPSAERVETLGAGWIAEEALGIGVYAALATHRVEDALLLAVNHSGDSDSTGSVCGNLLGALHGDHQLPDEWLRLTEGRAVIAAVADDLASECVRR
ncbi:ADP-ribosylglycohydrolase family protein [Streptomyces aureoverticillatus]|uniref:ADP-ribosylglycohydrolase family protein n=1 Tax=Streptomyces aureoverticillatus TaxID=66871 RepID=UPI0013D9D491|nr:ADP-ribosylglycohydrolase family protein [Streptomyces aureoverticillatus]QIB42619.1 ADP-ribosylglycohydrolase family protein [Streptomyces aureoverticillatus]